MRGHGGGGAGSGAAVIVKVCGVRTAEVAEIAVDAGADWIGIVFEPRSPRHASDSDARAVVAATRGRADVIGVFVEPNVDECDQAAARYGLAGVQVHGSVDVTLAGACAVPVIRGYNVSDERDALTIQWWPDCLVLLDAIPVTGELPGGTGRRLDRMWATEVARHRPIVLAGGLGADDVAAAIAAVRPYGVDASSRLEHVRGEKDPGLVQAYVHAARAGFAALNGDG